MIPKPHMQPNFPHMHTKTQMTLKGSIEELIAMSLLTKVGGLVYCT